MIPKNNQILFRGLSFEISNEVFIPYSAAEALVEEALMLPNINQSTILELGTGIGNISISLAKSLPDAKFIATEIIPAALEIAQKNARTHEVEDRITFLVSDLLSNISSYQPDLIISNLPFLPSERAKLLINNNEPITNIDGGEDGFDLYRKLFLQIKEKFNSPLTLIAEIDYTQRDLATKYIRNLFPNSEINIKYNKYHGILTLIIKF